MSRSALLLSATLALAGLLAFTPPAAAQSIAGKVVLAGWQEPVPSARVQLLGADMKPLSTTETDAQGRFGFPRVAPGTYYIQAVLGEAFSSLEGPIDLGEAEGDASAQLVMRSLLFEQALSCFAEERASSQGILAGVAYDPTTDTPLPGARVRVQWRPGGGRPAELEAEADAAGRFVFCGVPASVALSVSARALGRVSQREDGVTVAPAAVARLDIPVELGATSSLRILDAQREDTRPGTLATLEGRLLDAESGGPIATAAVSLAGLELEQVTDAAGRFRFVHVPPGEYAFQVSRLGYDWESGTVEVLEGARMVLELRAAPEAIALEAVVVRATTVETRMARASTQAPRILAGHQMFMAEQRAASVMEVIRHFPNLRIAEGQFETTDGIERGVCIESSRALQRFAVPEQRTPLPWCEMIAIVIDGAATIRGAEALQLLRVREIESIEFLPPTGAIRWGERAALNGALVIWTRGRGPHRAGQRDGGS